MTMTAGDGSWLPRVELVNESPEAEVFHGGRTAAGQLLHLDGTPVTSRRLHVTLASKPYPLPPGGSTELAVTISPSAEEMAALPAGCYRLTEVRWANLTTPDVDVEIRAG